MAGSERVQPRPNGPLTAPESQERARCGSKRERPGVVAIRMVTDPVSVTGFVANFSPMPRIAPPPFDSEIAGGVKFPKAVSSLLCDVLAILPRRKSSTAVRPKRSGVVYSRSEEHTSELQSHR